MSSNPRVKRQLGGIHFSILTAALVASCLCSAFLNLSFATLRRAGGLVSLERILLSLAGTLVTLLLIHLALSAVVLILYRYVPRLRFVPLVIWSGLTVLMIGALTPVWNLIVENLPIGGWSPAERLMTMAFVWSPIVTLPLFGYLIAYRMRTNEWAGHFFRGFIVTAPLLGVEIFLYVWAQVFWIHGMFSKESFACTAGFGLLALATLAVGSWLSRRIHPLEALLAFTLFFLVAPSAYRSVDQTPKAIPDDDRPECVMLLTVDTLRADTIEPYSQHSPTSWGTSAPALEALANDSVVFLEARSPSPWTKPSAASILTGLSPQAHGAVDLRSILPEETHTLAERLGEVGYYSGAIGRNTFLRDAFNFDQGFDDFEFFPRGNAGILGAGMLQRLLPRQFATKPTTEHLSDFAIDWLEQHRDRRFFLWLHYFDPHGPFEPPVHYLPQTVVSERIGTAFSNTAAIRNGDLVPDLEERDWIRQLYRAEVRHVSDEIGRVMQALEGMDLYDQCLIVFTSDHGEEFWEHGGFEHGHTLYDELLKVPFSIKLPSPLIQRHVGGDVTTESIVPTLLDLLEIPYNPKDFTAPSLAAWAAPQAPPVDFDEPIYSSSVHYFEDKEAVIFDNIKYIREPLTGHEELFDLLADPFETRSLHGEADELLATGRWLLDQRLATSEALRQRLLAEGGDARLDSDTLRELRALGYLQ